MSIKLISKLSQKELKRDYWDFKIAGPSILNQGGDGNYCIY